MKVFTIECCGEEHRIGLDEDGKRHLLDCDLEEEEAREVLGEEPSQCYRMYGATNSDCVNQSLCNFVCNGDAKKICLCLNLGADVHWNHNEALRLAIMGCDLNTAKLLIDRGANVNDSRKVMLWGSPAGYSSNAWVSILEEAQRYGPLEMVKLLKEAGAEE